MKGQQLFHSLLPGMTVVVLTTQPVWAAHVKIHASPTVLATSDSGVLLASEAIWELPKAGDSNFPAFTTSKLNTMASINPLSTITFGTNGSLLGEVPNKDNGQVFSLIPNTYTSNQNDLAINQHIKNQNSVLTVSQIVSPVKAKANLLQVDYCTQCGQKTLPQTLAQTANTNPSISAPPPSYLNPNPNPLAFPTQPQEVKIVGTQPITLQQAVELARRNNQSLQISLFTLRRTKAQLRQAQAALYPTLDLQGTITHSLSAGSRLQAKLQQQALGSSTNPSPSTSFSGGPQLNWSLYTSGQRLANIRQLEEQVHYYELDVERTAEDLRLNVATDYYNLQQQDEQIRIYQSAVTNDQSSLRDAINRFTAGVGTRFDVLQAQVQLANDQQNLTNAYSQERIARRTLAQLLNISQSVDISAADPVTPAGLWNRSLEDTIILAFQNRPELRQDLAQRNIYEQQRRQALATLGPQISLSANYNLLDNFNDNISVTDGYSVGVQASLRLFDGGAAQAEAAAAKNNIAIAEYQFSQERDQVRFDVEQAYSTLESNSSNIQSSAVAVAEATESLRLARLRFNAGVGTQTDVLTAESQLTQAQGNQVNAILNYNRALANLERAVTTRGLARS